ncbi:unnamed protein product [Caenorhabditis auriculariae]|uniref:Uncharacterized protein n=1 Tax=Caenorhabditis auriculariae TaxID=2777116 RepID=A0A8S1HRB9_9PELO|nr:unnamed protein product [Caenorhabditis auriculariae]
MEREMRLKAFMEEYARIVQLFDDIVSMKDSMGRLEKYMIIMVVQMLVALLGGMMFMCVRFFQSSRQRGEYELEHRQDGTQAPHCLSWTSQVARAPQLPYSVRLPCHPWFRDHPLTCISPYLLRTKLPKRLL